MTLVKQRGANKEYMAAKSSYLHTMFIQVPNAKGVSRDAETKNQTATGCEAEISHDITVAEGQQA